MPTLKLSSGEVIKCVKQRVNGDTDQPITYEQLQVKVQSRTEEPWVEVYNADAAEGEPPVLVNLNNVEALEAEPIPGE